METVGTIGMILKDTTKQQWKALFIYSTLQQYDNCTESLVLVIMRFHTRPTICGTSNRVTWDTSTAMLHEKCHVSCWIRKRDCIILSLRKWPWEARPSESKFCFCKPPWASTWQRSVWENTFWWYFRMVEAVAVQVNSIWTQTISNSFKLWNLWLIKLPEIKTFQT